MTQANIMLNFDCGLKVYFLLVFLVVGFLNMSAISNNMVYSQTTNQLSIPEPDPSCQYYEDSSNSHITEPTFPTDPTTNCPEDECNDEIIMDEDCALPDNPHPNCNISLWPNQCPYPPGPQPNCEIYSNNKDSSSIAEPSNNYRCPPDICYDQYNDMARCPNPFSMEDR